MIMNSFSGSDLTFVVCAYKECPYLRESMDSLVNQSEKANIIISTSTPNDYINKIANEYNIEVRVNPEPGQIRDYNFAIKQANTELVMLAHQDEILHKDFVKHVLEEINNVNDPIIAFTDYIEMHNDVVDEKQSNMVRIKKMLLLPLKSKKIASTIWGKRLSLRFGDPITHPSVVCVRSRMPEVMFREQYKAAMDWDLWERLSKEKGSFVYVDKILLYHRMNEMNQTAVLLKTTNERYENEYDIFCRFWPNWFSKILMKFYSKAYSNY